VRRPGYHAASRLYYAPTDPSMVTIALPDEVTTEDVWEARNLLENELLGDFPFDGQASRANALGAMLVPFLRDSIEGPTPLHLIDKPEAGTGAGLLAACISIPGPGPTSSLRSGHIRKTNVARRSSPYSRTGEQSCCGTTWRGRSRRQPSTRC
jgi:hypothetical protein